MSNVIGYIRVSTLEQDEDKQRHLLLKYAQQHKIVIDNFISITMSSTKSSKQRKIDELINILNKGDTLIVAELSRLGRSMLSTITLVSTLISSDINLVFIRQPELNTKGLYIRYV